MRKLSGKASRAGSHEAVVETSFVEVAELLGEELSDLHLTVVAGEAHLDNRITHPRVQKPGLAFAGHYSYIKPGRVQIVGESELEHLRTLAPEERNERCRRIASMPVPVLVVTKGLPALPANLHVTRQDPVQRIIDFSDGNRAAGLKVSQVNDKLVHLLIASVIMPDQDSTTSFVAAGVMHICREAGANCILAQ